MLPKNFEEQIYNIFHTSQFDKTSHKTCAKKLRKIFDKSEIEKFCDCFFKCLKIILATSQTHHRVDNVLEFAAKFVICFDMTEEIDPFTARVFDFLIEHHKARDVTVRFRICEFLKLLLNSMGDNAFIDDTLCDKIISSMQENLLDKSPKVRAQAVYALQRLQDPGNDDCSIIKLFIFHLCRDPNAEVRKAVLSVMGKNQKTLQAALTRIRDINDIVRKKAFEFLSKITVKSLTIKQRNEILSEGLKDRSEIVRKCVENILLPSWLTYFKGDYISLLKALDAEIGTDTCTMTLSVLFKMADLKTLLEQLPINKETGLIPLDVLSGENVLYWRCLLEFFHKENLISYIEMISPELTKFCAYINDFIEIMFSKQYELNEIDTHEFILLQFYKMVEVFDLSDEMGRKNLDNLIIHTLKMKYTSENITACIVKYYEKVVPNVNSRVNSLANVISELRLPLKQSQSEPAQPQAEMDDRILMEKANWKIELFELQDQQYKAIQNEKYLEAEELKLKIKELNDKIKAWSIPLEKPTTDAVLAVDVCTEKKDPETMIRCLGILCYLMEGESVKSLTPILRSLMEITVSGLNHTNLIVYVLTIRLIGLYSILDQNVAKKHLEMCSLLLMEEEEEPTVVLVEALKVVFNLLLLYGLEFFNITENTNSATDKNEKSRKLFNSTDDEISKVDNSNQPVVDGTLNLIKVIVALLGKENSELRTVAAEGLCKLMINQKISGLGILSRFIIICFNPVNDADIYLKQCLYSFFNCYIREVPDSQEVLEEVFFPTLKILYNAPNTSPLQQVDPYDVAEFILALTRPDITKKNLAPFSAHNNLAFAILAEILNPNTELEPSMLIKSLKNLIIHLDDETSKKDLMEAINKVKSFVNKNKRYVQYVKQFEIRVENPDASISDQEDSS